tara:strand:+ start:1604 stop:2089 length:486 start_codon:yes stop_codon:yes gene_type:complete
MVEIITTGGTIDKIYFDQKSEYEVGDPFIGELLQKMNVNIPFKIKSLMRIDSLDMKDIHREEICKHIKDCSSNKILITHGTDSMVETAQYINERIKDRVVVLTGSLKPAIFIDNDAIFNIASAFNAVQTLANGVYIIMNGQVFDPTNVQKNMEKNCFEKIS